MPCRILRHKWRRIWQGSAQKRQPFMPTAQTAEGITYRRLASGGMLGPRACVWSRRVRHYVSPSSLRGSAACCARAEARRAARPGPVFVVAAAAPRRLCAAAALLALAAVPSPPRGSALSSWSRPGPCGAPGGAGGARSRCPVPLARFLARVSTGPTGSPCLWPFRAAALLRSASGVPPDLPPVPVSPSGASREARGLRPGAAPRPSGTPLLCLSMARPATVPGFPCFPCPALCAGGASCSGEGLDFQSVLWYFIPARPVPLLRGLPWARNPRTAKTARSKDRAVFSCSWAAQLLPRFGGSDFGRVNQISPTRPWPFRPSGLSRNCQPRIFPYCQKHISPRCPALVFHLMLKHPGGKTTRFPR